MAETEQTIEGGRSVPETPPLESSLDILSPYSASETKNPVRGVLASVVCL